MIEKLIRKILALGLIYLIGAFIGGNWDLMTWHWVGKVFFVLFALGTVAED